MYFLLLVSMSFTVLPRVLHIILPLLDDSAHFDESGVIIGMGIMGIY